ncbi:MAG: diphosphatase [Sphingomonadales bacterium]|jgi:NAD+ diphosphatase|nr:diphosphatase [Sphingomonadales bacterium]MEA3044088.1 diphosphatase [Sphingomonadales bacterium]MEA3046797.1 diphosphatase [Sphingomonadales bacterium]
MSAPGFTGAGLDRADHLRLDAERVADMMANGDARLLRLAELDPVLDEEGRLAWGPLDGAAGDHLFLGLDAGAPLFAPLVRIDAPGQRAWKLFGILSVMSARDAAIWGAARSVNEWHNRHRFCGICGSGTAPFRAGWGRKCGHCGAEHFPRVDPVVIMLAEHDGRVLLGRQPQYPQGRYSALAGFVEPGESIEEAVARELLEEAGVVASDVRYVASQPWPFPGSLMIACLARAESDALSLDANELEDGFWATRDEVCAALAGDPAAPFLAPPPFAIANTLLTRWSAGE